MRDKSTMTAPRIGRTTQTSPIGGLTARAGRRVRFVLGADEFPALDAFSAPGSPSWTADPAVVPRRDGNRFVLLDAGNPILTGSADVARWRLELDLGNAEILGFGAANGAANRNASRFRILALDTLMYAIPGSSYTALPFFLARNTERTIGVLLATTYPLDVEVDGGSVRAAAACDMDGTPIDVIVFQGTPLEILRDLAELVGRSLLPPAWALGFHQSRWSYRTQNAVLDVARRLREHDLPADVVHLDIHYMDRYRVFTFDPQRFPDPEAMHAELRELGLRTMAIVDPGVSVAPYAVYETLRKQRLLLERSDGTAYEGRVWPGATVFPDFTQAKAREVWGEFHAPLVATGVAGFWNDMNDPVFRVGRSYDPLAEDVIHGGRVPHRRARNLYANGMAEAAARGLEGLRPGRRPFVLSRSGFLGIQRHAAVWTGDNHSTWEHLRENLAMVLNLGLSGVPITGADVGGFARGPGRLGVFKPRRPSVELFVRWMELGALMPFFRVHNTLFARSQDPWSFGSRALLACRYILRRRYRLLPLLYRLALEAHEQGLPLVRPLWLHYQVPPGQGLGQFLLGEDVLAAPVLHKGQREKTVWLPGAASWIHWHTGQTYAGGERITVPAPLGSTPLFVRSGAALFLTEPRRNADETLAAPLALEVSSPRPGQTGQGLLFLDDGESSSGERFLLHVSVHDRDAGSLQVGLTVRASSFRPVQSCAELRVPAGWSTMSIDGRRVELIARTLQAEDRPRTVMTAIVPLETTEILLD